MVTKRFENPPVTEPSRAANSFFAEPAIAMLACVPPMPINCTRSSAPIEYQVYSLAASPPKRLNITSGTFWCSAATPPIFASPNGMRITEIRTTRIAWIASTTAEALSPPSIMNTATRLVDTR